MGQIECVVLSVVMEGDGEPLKVCRQTRGTGHFSALRYVPGSVKRAGGLQENISSERLLYL